MSRIPGKGDIVNRSEEYEVLLPHRNENVAVAAPLQLLD